MFDSSLCLAVLSFCGALSLLACTLDRDGKLVAAGAGGGGQGGSPGPTVGGGPSTGGQGGGGGVANPPPGPVAGFSALIDGDVALGWTNPADADLAGVLVVHRPDNAVSFSPEDGLSYDVGTTPMANQEVIFSSLGTAATLAPAIPGLRHHFAAWAFDQALQYSPIAVTDGLENAIGEQTAQIRVFLDGTVMVEQQPPNFPLVGSAQYDAPSQELRVQLTVKNDAARVIYNLKGLVSALNQGAVINAPRLPPVGGDPFVYYGPEGLDVAEDLGRNLVIDGVDGSVDPIIFEMRLVDDRWIIGQDRRDGARRGDSTLLLVDSSGSRQQGTLSVTAAAGSINFRGLEVSQDGRTVFVGAKSTPFVTALDLVKLGSQAGSDLGGGDVGMVSGVALSPDGDKLYAALTTGAHHWGGVGSTSGTAATSTTLSLVELDPITLMETQRVDLVVDDAAARLTRTLAVSRDGTRAAVVVRHPLNSGIDAQIFFVDLVGMSVIDTDPATGPVDPVTIAFDIRPDSVVWDEDDGQLFVATSYDSEVEVIDTATFSTSTWTPGGVMERTSSLFVMNGMLYVARGNIGAGTAGTALSRFATSDGTESALSSGLAEAHGVAGFDDRLFAFSANSVAVFDAGTHVRLDMDGDAGNGTTNIPVGDGRGFAAHFIAVTPF